MACRRFHPLFSGAASNLSWRKGFQEAGWFVNLNAQYAWECGVPTAA